MKKKVLINGALGHMGQAVLAALKAADGDLVPAVGIDLQTGDFPGALFASAEAVDVPFDIAIDFSRPQATMAVLELCLREGKRVQAHSGAMISMGQRPLVKSMALKTYSDS